MTVNVHCAEGAINVSWSPNPDAQYFHVAAVSNTGARLYCNSSSTTCTINNLPCGQHYNVTVLSVRDDCESQPSAVIETSSGKLHTVRCTRYTQCVHCILALYTIYIVYLRFNKIQKHFTQYKRSLSLVPLLHCRASDSPSAALEHTQIVQLIVVIYIIVKYVSVTVLNLHAHVLPYHPPQLRVCPATLRATWTA